MEIDRRQLLVMVLSALTGCGTELRIESSSSHAATSTAASAVSATTSTSSAVTSSTIAKNTLPARSMPVRELEVIERAGWQAAPPGPGLIEHVISRLTVHHTAVELTDNRLAPARLRAHQHFHQTDRGWPDLAYHFAIDQRGNVYEGRSPDFRGDTATNYDPAGHFLAVLEGNFDQQSLPAPQRASLIDLLAWAATEYRIDPVNVGGHRDYAQTSCPGEAVYAVISTGELTKAVQARIGEGAINLVYLRGEEALQRVAEIEA